MLGILGCNIPIMSRRNCSRAAFLGLWLLQFFHPWPLDAGVPFGDEHSILTYALCTLGKPSCFFFFSFLFYGYQELALMITQQADLTEPSLQPLAIFNCVLVLLILPSLILILANASYTANLNSMPVHFSISKCLPKSFVVLIMYYLSDVLSCVCRF